MNLFDSYVLSVLNYGCEIWGPLLLRRIETCDFKTLCESLQVEKLNIKVCKYILGVNKYATNAAVTGELGGHPLAIKITKHAFNYWKRLCS